MIDNGVIQYQIDNPEELMEKFYQGGNEILLALRNYVTSPENRKKPRTWGTIEAAKMVGVSDPTFRKLLENNQNISKQGKIPYILVLDSSLVMYL